jgi:DHA2 family multidrug resistance protein-like MFS transporter
MLSVDISVLLLALPALSADLEPTATQLLWISDIYAFMLAGFLVTMGTLGDRIGRGRLLLIGAAAFGIASVVAAFSVNASMLIAARAALGIAGATLAPSTLALISNMFLDQRQRGTAIAIWTSCFMSGIALGPVIGGLLLESFWWGSAFLIGVPRVHRRRDVRGRRPARATRLGPPRVHPSSARCHGAACACLSVNETATKGP